MNTTALFSAALPSAFSPAASAASEAAEQQEQRVKYPRVLSIAGSDPSGGAGIQADIKAISAHGGYAMAAVTALTAQNTVGVHGVHTPPAEFLTAQLDAVSADIAIDAVKIGMLGTTEVMTAVGEWLRRTQPPVVVLDPVMVATSGDALMDQEALTAMLSMLALVDLVTPNLPELGVLLGQPAATSWDAAIVQGQELAAAHQIRVLVKGGHLSGADCPDALVAPDGTVREFCAPRVDTPNTHGTGCSLSAAVATLQAQTGDWGASIERAKDWLGGALETAHELKVGGGPGPINHLHELWATAAPRQESFSRELWRDCAGQRAAIASLDFIKELAAGTLARHYFAYYLAQDALYLGSYSRVLAKASSLAPTEAEQKFWAAGAQSCLDVEISLHRDWLSQYLVDSDEAIVQGPVTKHYVDHLQAVAFSGSYAEVVAAVLPCYWLYADVGAMLHADYLAFSGASSSAGSPELSHGRPAEHPYGAWLQTYASDDFAQATKTAISILDAAARRGSARERDGMKAAFAHSAQYEVDFFAAPHSYALRAAQQAPQVKAQ